jgi:hypothetical protein
MQPGLPDEIGLIMDVLDLMMDRLAALVEAKEDDDDDEPQRPTLRKWLPPRFRNAHALAKRAFLAWR